uniref:Uncharacterized protein n=1 Tax=Medicago truncatula TaxID=3880 RepID=Q2HTL6_MEDTR|nr:hypothetical protein MtrDRAFT_AC150244g32v2 [Medicago truncatula]
MFIIFPNINSNPNNQTIFPQQIKYPIINKNNSDNNKYTQQHNKVADPIFSSLLSWQFQSTQINNTTTTTHH